MTFPLIKKTTAGTKLLIFILLVVFGLAFSSVIEAFITMLGGDGISQVGKLQLAQICSQVVAFMLPPVLYAVLVKERPLNYLGFKKLPTWSLLGIIAMFTILPFNGMVTEWNANISFPDSMRAYEESLKDLYEKIDEITGLMLNAGGTGNFVINLLIFGAFAAIGEELFFRSVIQKSLVKICKNAHVGIIATAIFFSAFHFDFYGFFPRVILGLMLGYMFHLSGSIFSSMLMHFVNNATIVIIYYLNNQGVIDINADEFGSSSSIGLIFLSLISTIIIFIICNRFKNRTEKLTN